MRLNTSPRLALVVVCAGAMWGCGDSRSQLSPTSPSSLSSQTSPRTPGTILSAMPRRVDNDGDGYEDGEVPLPDPNAGPMPDPGSMPNPDPLPPQDGVVVPVQLTINIVGTFGAAAFAPNPLQAAIGNTIVWSNTDLIVHDIVLDDGTPVGILAPGQSSAPISISTPTAGYHCTLHPSMVGQVTTIPPELPVPTDPSQIPMPDPGYTPPPSDDPYDYDDGYDDDYGYLRIAK
jgi:plastocyanin